MCLFEIKNNGKPLHLYKRGKVEQIIFKSNIFLLILYFFLELLAFGPLLLKGQRAIYSLYNCISYAI